MSRARTNPYPADATPFGRAWRAIRALPGVLQVALTVLALLVVASPFVISAAITTFTSSQVGAGAASGPAEASVDETDGKAPWRVVDVVDGDTLDVRAIDGTGERVRVIGIDTPERGECGYAGAAGALAELVLGEEVVLGAGARDDRDVHGRLLRYVDREVETAGPTTAGPSERRIDAGLVLLERGLAVARYDSRDGYGEHPREAAYVAADGAVDHPTCDA